MTTAVRSRSFFKRPWVGPLAFITFAFLAFSLPPYLTLDPGQSNARIPADLPMYYPLLVTHIFFGSVALVSACIQVWPKVRQKRPALHRWSGRVYVFGGVLPAGLAILMIAPFGPSGANQQVGNTVLAILWLATTVTGFRLARKRRYAQHREWMIRSFALSFSILASRFWLGPILYTYDRETLLGQPTLNQAASDQAGGVATWMGWISTLLIAEWWLQRQRHRQADQARERRAARAEAATDTGTPPTESTPTPVA